MKVLRISDTLHQHLKDEAKAQGRTLQWWVEEKLAQGSANVYTSPKNKSLESDGLVGEVTFIDPPVSSQFVPAANKFPDTPVRPIKSASELTEEINMIQLEIDTADLDNQDPDYWAIINGKKRKIQELWTEWHQVTGR